MPTLHIIRKVRFPLIDENSGKDEEHGGPRNQAKASNPSNAFDSNTNTCGPYLDSHSSSADTHNNNSSSHFSATDTTCTLVAPPTNKGVSISVSASAPPASADQYSPTTEHSHASFVRTTSMGQPADFTCSSATITKPITDTGATTPMPMASWQMPPFCQCKAKPHAGMPPILGPDNDKATAVGDIIPGSSQWCKLQKFAKLSTCTCSNTNGIPPTSISGAFPKAEQPNQEATRSFPIGPPIKLTELNASATSAAQESATPVLPPKEEKKAAVQPTVTQMKRMVTQDPPVSVNTSLDVTASTIRNNMSMSTNIPRPVKKMKYEEALQLYMKQLANSTSTVTTAKRVVNQQYSSDIASVTPMLTALCRSEQPAKAEPPIRSQSTQKETRTQPLLFDVASWFHEAEKQGSRLPSVPDTPQTVSPQPPSQPKQPIQRTVNPGKDSADASRPGSSSFVPPQNGPKSANKLSQSRCFPQKLRALLEDTKKDGYSNVISWQPHGRAIKVHDRSTFERIILPKYWFGGKYTSFQRQLSLWDFKRFTEGVDRGGYYHKDFVEDQPQLMSTMKRNKIKGTPRKAPDPSTEPDFYLMTNTVPPSSSPKPTDTPTSSLPSAMEGRRSKVKKAETLRAADSTTELNYTMTNTGAIPSPYPPTNNPTCYPPPGTVGQLKRYASRWGPTGAIEY